MPKICENSDCGGFLDQPSVSFWDKHNERVIVVCRECARSFAASPRYDLIDQLPEKGNE